MYAGFSARSNTIGDPAEAMGSLWYHDHHLDYTAQNVYKGMFGCYNLFDDQDTGDRPPDCACPAVNMMYRFSSLTPCSTKTTSWYSTCLISMASSATNIWRMGRSSRPWKWTSAAIGSACTSRTVALVGVRSLQTARTSCRSSKFQPMDLLPNAVKVSSVRLAVAERADIVVDFSTISAQQLYIVNRLEQVNGRGPTGKLLTPGVMVVQINIGSPPARIPPRGRRCCFKQASSVTGGQRAG